MRWSGPAVLIAAAVVLAQALPEPWRQSDVGNVTVPGRVAFEADRLTVAVAGADIWGTADAFCYVHQPLRGDGAVTAKVLRIDRSDDWAKAGVMIRESLAPGSPYAFVFLKPRNGASTQYRAAAGEGAQEAQRLSDVGSSLWVHLDRSGNQFTAYIRTADEAEWQPAGSVTVPMGEEVLVGAAVTSHAYKISARGQFAGLTVHER